MRIAVLGLGLIGSIWARHLHSDGHQVRAWNRSPKPDQPGWTADASDAVRDAELVLVVVADGAAVLSVLEAVRSALPPRALVCQHSTIGYDETLAAAQLVRSAGARFLDMPFTGSKPAAEQRQNVFFVAGEDSDAAEVQPLYARLAKAQVLAGAVGQATAMKLSFNLLLADLNQAMCEAQELARRAGIPPEAWFAALDLNVGKSPYADLKKPKWLNSDYSPQFAIKHMAKDVRLAQRLAAAHALAMPLTDTATETLTAAETHGLGDLDFSAILTLIREPRR
jgi:3-hydroxyisobutyrate dehydrogenase-like beta-hydroxyacid dehydrogenase